jgi:hypothetical protein
MYTVGDSPEWMVTSAQLMLCGHWQLIYHHLHSLASFSALAEVSQPIGLQLNSTELIASLLTYKGFPSLSQDNNF